MTDMELKSLRMVLQRLSALVEGWGEAEEIPQLERDLALELLRGIYAALRFENPAADAVERVSAAVAPIDLGEVLSLDEPFAVSEAAGSDADAEDGDSAAGAYADSSAAEQPEERPSDSDAAPEEAACDSSSPAADTGPTDAAAEHAEHAGTRSSERPESGFESVVSAEAAAKTEMSTVPGATEPDAGSAPEASVELSPAPESASETVSEPASAIGTASGTTYVTPTLFGLEEATVRHRYKQRVIMSLYGEDSQPAPQPAAAKASSSEVRKQESLSSSSPEETRQPERSGNQPERTGNLPVESFSDARNGSEAARPLGFEPAPAEAVAPESLPGEFHAAESVPAVAPDAVPAEGAVPVLPQGENPATPTGSSSGTSVLRNQSVRPEAGVSEIKSGQAAASGAVLGEVINHDVQTLADTIAPPRDVASELRRSEPVTHLGTAIGINDKFLMIRDLFDGDAAAYETAIGTLDRFTDLDECLIHIAENYVWNADTDGARLLMDLLERKFA